MTSRGVIYFMINELIVKSLCGMMRSDLEFPFIFYIFMLVPYLTTSYFFLQHMHT